MKIRIIVSIMLTLLAIAMTACQPNQNTEAIDPLLDRAIEVEPEDTAYPIIEHTVPQIEAAYPITEEDLQMLIRTWSLSSYSEDGVAQEPKSKTLQFNADGSYQITTEMEMSSGNWSARLLAIESTLILDPGTDESLTYEIVELSQTVLNLHTIREGSQIDEVYLPAD